MTTIMIIIIITFNNIVIMIIKWVRNCFYNYVNLCIMIFQWIVRKKKKKRRKIKSNYKKIIKINQKQTKQTNRQKKPKKNLKKWKGQLKTPNGPSHKKGRQLPFQVPNSNSNAARKWKFLGASVSFPFGKRTLNLSLSLFLPPSLASFASFRWILFRWRRRRTRRKKRKISYGGRRDSTRKWRCENCFFCCCSC